MLIDMFKQLLSNPEMQTLCLGIGVVGLVIVGGAIALLYFAAQSVRDLEIPEDADFFETMQVIPITIPIALDLLDLVLDVFSAPISWIILNMMGLGALKMVTIFESIIPGTQLIPTMTIGWIISRTLVKNRQSPMRDRLRQEQYANRDRIPLGRGGRGGSGRADYYRGLALPPGQRAGRAGDEIISEGRSVRPRGNRMLGGINAHNDDDLIEGEIVDDEDLGDRAYRRGQRQNDFDDYGASEDFEDEEY
jgi:hypothetical protein